MNSQPGSNDSTQSQEQAGNDYEPTNQQGAGMNVWHQAEQIRIAGKEKTPPRAQDVLGDFKPTVFWEHLVEDD